MSVLKLSKSPAQVDTEGLEDNGHIQLVYLLKIDFLVEKKKKVTVLTTPGGFSLTQDRWHVHDSYLVVCPPE